MNVDKIRELLNEIEKLENTKELGFTMGDVVEAVVHIRYANELTSVTTTVILPVTDQQLELIMSEYGSGTAEAINECKEEIAQELGIIMPVAPEKKKRSRSRKKTNEEIKTAAVAQLKKAGESLVASPDAELPPLAPAPALEEEAPAAAEVSLPESITVGAPEAAAIEPEEDVREVKDPPVKKQKKENKDIRHRLAGVPVPKDSNILIMNGVDQPIKFNILDVIKTFYETEACTFIAPTDDAIVTAIQNIQAGQIVILTDVKLSVAVQLKELFGESVATVLTGGTVPVGADVMSYIRAMHDVGSDKFKYDHNLAVDEKLLATDHAVAVENYAYEIAPLLGFQFEEEFEQPELAGNGKLSAADIEV